MLNSFSCSSRLLFIFVKEKIQYEWNARNQITLWGPRGEILDYAVKQWSGVTADYFKPRWEIFIQQLQNALDFGMTFNQTAYIQTVFRVVEQPFTLSSKSYSEFPIGTVSQNILFSK
jgi:alpha-N-acetylglucosaminidase